MGPGITAETLHVDAIGTKGRQCISCVVGSTPFDPLKQGVASTQIKNGRASPLSRVLHRYTRDGKADGAFGAKAKRGHDIPRTGRICCFLAD